MCNEKNEEAQQQPAGVQMSPAVKAMLEAFAAGPASYGPSARANLGMNAAPVQNPSGMTAGKMPFGYQPKAYTPPAPAQKPVTPNYIAGQDFFKERPTFMGVPIGDDFSIGSSNSAADEILRTTGTGGSR